MSHEGIRIVDRATAEREEQAERPLPHEAVTPRKVRVDKTGGTGVEIEWADGERSAWTFGYLRNACPCAMCLEERKADGRSAGESAPVKDAGPFAMYKAPARPLDVTPVGKYALRFRWNDGHESGIYSWEYLRRLGVSA